MRHLGLMTEKERAGPAVSVLDVEVRSVDPHVEVSVTKEVPDGGGSPGSRLDWARSWSQDGGGRRRDDLPHCSYRNSHSSNGPPGVGDGGADSAGDERLDLTDDRRDQILVAQCGGGGDWSGGGDGGGRHWSGAGADGAGAGAAVAGAAADGGVDSA